MRTAGLFILFMSAFFTQAAHAEQRGYNPVFPDSPSPFNRDFFRGPSESYFRPGEPSPYSRWRNDERFFDSPFEHAFRLDSEVFPSKAGIYIRPIRAKADLIFDLKLNAKTTVALVSKNCTKNTMTSAAYAFQNLYKFQMVKRYTTYQEIYASIEQLPAGTETVVLADHGNAGFIGPFNVENVGEFAKRLRAKKVKNIILGSCSAAWGPQGEQFISELANASGATVYAWDQPVFMFSNVTYLERGGNLVIGIPDSAPHTSEPADLREPIPPVFPR